MEIQKLKQKLYEQKNKIGLVRGSINLKEYDEAEQDISTGISLEWDIEINVKKGFNPIQDRRQKAYARKKKITDGLETMLSDLSLHEFAHWELPFESGKGCPYDIYNHDKILEAVKQALPEDKKKHAHYVTNAFEDLMINPRAREFNKEAYQRNEFSGQILFWDNEGLRLKKQGKKTYTPFFEAFVKLNMYLLGDNSDRALLKRNYSNNEEIDSAVEKTIRDLELQENIQDTSALFHKENWAKVAKVFAKNLSGLLKKAPKERLSAYSQKGDAEDEEQTAESPSGNGIEQKLKTKQGKEEIAYGRYSADEKQSTNITSYEQLDSLYKKLAKSIPVKVEAMTKEQNLQISPLTLRAFDEEKDEISKIKLSKLFLTDNGLQFAYPNQPLTINSRSKFQRKSFPDFKMIVLDNSGSMEEPLSGSNNGKTNFIPWGDNSKYHYALLGYYGIENFLQQQQIAQYIKHGLSLFSSQTRYKEAEFLEMNTVRKLALAPEFNNTNLDAKVLTNSLKGRESFVLSISDGEIGNWNSEKESFKELAQKNYYAHIQIGNKESGPKFCKDLESWQIPIFYVGKGDDLSKLMVDITNKTYDKFIKISGN